MFNVFSDILMIRRFVSSEKWWTLQCLIATGILMYSRKSKAPKTDPCGTPHLRLDVIYSTECYDPQCQKLPSSRAFIIASVRCLRAHEVK